MPNPVDRTLRMTNNSSFEFFRAITRCPAASIVDGLRAKDTGTPDLKQMLADHAHYVATLKRTGAEVIDLFGHHRVDPGLGMNVGRHGVEVVPHRRRLLAHRTCCIPFAKQSCHCGT